MCTGEDVCCPWCKSDKCEALCLKFCCCCCKGLTRDPNQNHRYLSHGQLTQQHDTKQSTSGLPTKRQYRFPQKYREFIIPPHLGDQEEIKEQPRKSPSPFGIVQDSTQYGKDESSLSDAHDFVDTEEGDTEERPRFSAIERSPEPGWTIVSSIKKHAHKSQMKPPDTSLIKKKKPEEIEPVVCPVVQFTLFFDEQNTMLTIRIIQAINLPTQSPENGSKSFVKVYLLPSKVEEQQSCRVDGTHSPVFDHAFRFLHIPLDSLRHHMVVMRFYINVNHFVGGTLYSLKEGDLTGGKIIEDISEFDEEEGLKVSL